MSDIAKPAVITAESKSGQSAVAAVVAPPPAAPMAAAKEIDLDSPATAAAAVKIQAGFRGMKARRESRALAEAARAPIETSLYKRAGDAGWGLDLSFLGNDKTPVVTGIKDDSPASRLGVVRVGQRVLSINGKSTVGIGSRKLNQLFKKQGLLKVGSPGDMDLVLDRKLVAVPSGEDSTSAASKSTVRPSSSDQTAGLDDDDNERKDLAGLTPEIDLTDPETAAAAVKIQAGFRGMKARRESRELASAAAKTSSIRNVPTTSKTEPDLKNFALKKPLRQVSSRSPDRRANVPVLNSASPEDAASANTERKMRHHVSLQFGEKEKLAAARAASAAADSKEDQRFALEKADYMRSMIKHNVDEGNEFKDDDGARYHIRSDGTAVYRMEDIREAEREKRLSLYPSPKKTSVSSTTLHDVSEAFAASGRRESELLQKPQFAARTAASAWASSVAKAVTGAAEVNDDEDTTFGFGDDANDANSSEGSRPGTPTGRQSFKGLTKSAVSKNHMVISRDESQALTPDSEDGEYESDGDNDAHLDDKDWRDLVDDE